MLVFTPTDFFNSFILNIIIKLMFVTYQVRLNNESLMFIQHQNKSKQSTTERHKFTK